MNLRVAVPFSHLHLPEPPTIIEDIFPSVLGNKFYYMHRIRVLVNHCYKKGFFIYLEEVFYTWDPNMLQKIIDKKKQIYNLSDNEIYSYIYFNID